MVRYLFKSIPKILFEPLAVTALIWIVLALFFFRKRDRVLYWLIFLSVVFMFAWRLAFSSIMLSSRYSSLLIYPGVIFTACLCFRAQSVFRWLFRKLGWIFPGQRTVCNLLSIGLFIGLTTTCIAKTFRTSPHGNYISDTVKTFQKAVKFPAYIHSKEAGRIAWYTEEKNVDIQLLEIPSKSSALPFIRQRVGESRNIPGYHFFFYDLIKGETAPSQESLKDVLAGGTWDILDQRDVSKRKKFILAVYKPVCPNIEEWTEPIPVQQEGNLVLNGGFEHILRGKPLENFRERCRKDGIRDYSDSDGRTLPSNWWFNVTSATGDNPPDIRLISQSPLAGKWSLYVNGLPPRKTAIVDTWFRLPQKGEYRFSLLLKAIGGDLAEVLIKIRAKDREKVRDLEVFTFRLQGGKTYRIQGTFSPDESMEYAALQIHVAGCVMVDQVRVVPR